MKALYIIDEMKILVMFLTALLFLGCQSRKEKSFAVYQKQLEEIESAFKNKQITTAEYLRLKQDAENAHQQRIVPQVTPNNYQPYKSAPVPGINQLRKYNPYL